MYPRDKRIYFLLIMSSWNMGLSIDEANDILIGMNMKPLNSKKQMITDNGGQDNGQNIGYHGNRH